MPVAAAGTAVDGWSSVASCPCWKDGGEDLWFARARYGAAGNWLAALGEDSPFAVWAQGPNGTPFNSGYVYPFELDYDNATHTATFTIDMVNDPEDQTDIAVTYANAIVTSDGALSIDVQSPVGNGDTTILDNVKLNGVALTGDDGLTSTGTGSAVVRHLCVCGDYGGHRLHADRRFHVQLDWGGRLMAAVATRPRSDCGRALVMYPTNEKGGCRK